MGIGGCVLLMAAGAILTFGVDWQLESVNVDVIGVILMIVGLIGIMTFMSVYRRRGRGPDADGDGGQEVRIIND